MEEDPGGTLVELRRRLYRRDPPADAVLQYLAALERVRPLETDRPHVVRRSRLRTPAAVAAALTVVAVAATGLGMARQASATAAAPVVRAASALHVDIPTAPGSPLGGLYGGPATTGLFDAGGSRAVVSVLCAGDGILRLTIGPEPAVVLTCEPGGPALAMLESAEDLDRFTVGVAPQAGVRWSLSVGAVTSGSG